jgi:hypothetical protein
MFQWQPGLFKIPTWRRWMVLATSAELIEDIKKAPDDILSREPNREVRTMNGFDAGSTQSRQFIEADYTLRMLNREDPYQNHILRSKLTRNMETTFDKVQGELVQALAECIPVAGDGM